MTLNIKKMVRTQRRKETTKIYIIHTNVVSFPPFSTLYNSNKPPHNTQTHAHTIAKLNFVYILVHCVVRTMTFDINDIKNNICKQIS